MNPYLRVVEKLPEIQDVSAVALPDGSIDRYHEVLEGHHGRISKKDEFVRRLKAGTDNYRLVLQRTEPGGIAVNMALQGQSLGLDIKLYGHLDHSVLTGLGMETESMGEPARVTICSFDDGELVLVHESQDILNWSLDELGTGEELKRQLSADLICCANWASIPGMTDDLEVFRNLEPDAELFSFDPGPLLNAREDGIESLFNALGMLDEEIDVIVHANIEELEKVSDAINAGGSEEERIKEVREEAGISAYVLHDKPRAAAATREGFFEVENIETERVRTSCGAGDRFDMALSAGLVKGWSWEEALALGNLCAVHYVENNSTATREDIRKQVKKKIGGTL